MSRVVMDAVNIETGEAIYFNSHAKATYLSDGRNVESVLTEIDENVKNRNVSAVEHVSVDDAETYVTNADLDKILNNISDVLDRIIGVDEEDIDEGTDESILGTFSVARNNITSQFEIGMTWRDYVNSEYNVFNSSYNSDFHMGFVWLDDNYTISLNDYSQVTPDDEIINNQVYRVELY